MRQRPVDSIENPNGRDLWVERMVAHSRNLAGVRPSVECWHSRPPLARPRSARARAADESFHNNEVLHLQQRIEEIHQPQRRSRTTQSTNPGSRQRAEQLSRNRQARLRQTDSGSGSHRANLQHMIRRIDDLGSVTERRKNQYDTSVYPALLLRRPEEVHPSLEHELALKAAARAAPRPAPTSAERARAAAERQARAEAIADERMRAQAPRSVGRAGGARPASSPAASSRSSPRARSRVLGAGRPLLGAEYDEYARGLTAAIVAQRLVREDELRAFLRRALDDEGKAHLDRAELEARTREVAAEFFCRLDE